MALLFVAGILHRGSGVSDSDIQKAGADDTRNTRGSASSLRHRRTESKSSVKSPVLGRDCITILVIVREWKLLLLCIVISLCNRKV